MEQAAFSVTELNNRIRELIDLDPLLSDAYVTGELSNYKIYPSGHHYFTLKDSESSLRCVMFRSSAARLRFRPENGMSVLVRGRVAVYPRDGVYQLYCSALAPLGTGDLQIAFEQLKARLSAEGLFDTAHKKALPLFPQRIAIITSSAGAAVHDMIRILRERWPMAQPVILPVRVQGAEAPAEIAGAIRYANAHKIADLIITGRGGGSIEDLWAFNDEITARAIYHSEIPVISAVGHEPDVTISDYVADARASTPSNAAEIAVPDKREIYEQLASLRKRAVHAQEKKLLRLRERVDAAAGKRVMCSPAEQISLRRLRTDRAAEQLSTAMERVVSAKKKQYISLASALDAMSPLRVMTRGYAHISDIGGRTVKSVRSVSRGESVHIRFSDGTALCTVEDVLENS